MRRPNTTGRNHLAATLLLLAACLPACEEDLPPRAHFGRPFSLYGVLSPDLDTQSVRVYPLEDFPTLGAPALLDVDFTSTDLTTGAVEVWRDSAVAAGPNGHYEHLFWAPFQAQFDHRYRVDVVRRSDGARSYADVRIPPPATVRLVDPDSIPLRVRIDGADIRALNLEIEYRVGSGPNGAPPIYSYWFSYQQKVKQDAQGWEFEIPLLLDRYWVQTWYTADIHGGGIGCPLIALREMNLHVLVGDTAWNPPGAVFDPDVLSHPTTMTNVQNGFGFIGGGYRIEEHLRPSRKAVEEACFYYYVR